MQSCDINAYAKSENIIAVRMCQNNNLRGEIAFFVAKRLSGRSIVFSQNIEFLEWPLTQDATEQAVERSAFKVK